MTTDDLFPNTTAQAPALVQQRACVAQLEREFESATGSHRVAAKIALRTASLHLAQLEADAMRKEAR